MKPGVAVKVCGLTRPEDAALAARLGAVALGVVFAPSPRQVDGERAAEVLGATSARVARVGVFVDPDPEQVAEAVQRCDLDWVQLSGTEPPERAVEIARAARSAARHRRPPRLIKALHVGSREDLLSASDYPADAFLLDAPPVDGRMGGTGRAFDWRVAGSLPWPRARVVLGGGLTAGNVATAMAAVRPAAVDVCSGVEAAPGIKEAGRLALFLAAAREAATGLARDDELATGAVGAPFLDPGETG